MAAVPPDYRRLPDWCPTGRHASYPEDRYVTAVGVATGPWSADLLDQANKNAMDGLASTLCTRVRARSEVRIGQNRDGDRVEVTEERVKQVLQESDVTLQGGRFPVEPAYDESSRTLYVLGVLDRKRAADLLLGSLEQSISDLRERFDAGTRPLEKGQVGPAIAALDDVIEKGDAGVDSDPIIRYLWPDHPGLTEALEQRRGLLSSAQSVLESLPAALRLSIDRPSTFLPAHASDPIRFALHVGLRRGERDIPAAGVPLRVSTDGSVKLSPASLRTGPEGSIAVTAVPRGGRDGPVSIHLQIMVDAGAMVEDGLPQGMTAKLPTLEKTLTFLPAAAGNVLVGAVVETRGADPGEAARRQLEGEVESLLLEAVAGAGADAEPLSKRKPAMTELLNEAPDEVAKKLELEGRILCRARVKIEIVQGAVTSAVATWQGLDMIAVRESEPRLSGFLRGEKPPRGRYGTSALAAATAALEDLLDLVGERVRTEVARHGALK